MTQYSTLYWLKFFFPAALWAQDYQRCSESKKYSPKLRLLLRGAGGDRKDLNPNKKKGDQSMSKTEQNLSDAFAGESQANRKYLAFAKQAEQEGYKPVAKLFRAAAEAETVHAHAHLRTLGGVGKTADNLKTAIAGETHEFKKMYPEFIEIAKKESNKAAERSFNFANEVEKIHAGLYQKALDNLGKNVDVDYYVCSVCGMTVEKEAPEKCPVCGAAKKAFFKVS
jgi:rubrerythrin